jgi:hypothetical protein
MNYIDLYFDTGGKGCKITIPDAYKGATDEEVKAAMDEMIESGAYSANSGLLAAIDKAELRVVSSTGLLL